MKAKNPLRGNLKRRKRLDAEGILYVNSKRIIPCDVQTHISSKGSPSSCRRLEMTLNILRARSDKIDATVASAY